MTCERWLVWYGLLHKRLLKKAGFLLILCAIPVIALLTARISDGEQGLVRVAAAPETVWETAALSVAEGLQSDGSILSVTVCNSAEEARQLVAAGNAETAWIFSTGLEEKLLQAARGEQVTLVRVLLQEENVFAAAVREKLYGGLFGQISYAMFRDFVQRELPESNVPEALLREIYDAYDYPQGLVDFVFLDSETDPLENASLLLSPLRGLLAVLLLLAGMAAALYAKKDEKQGVFAMLPPRKRVLPLMGTIFAAVSMTAAFVMAALVLSGVCKDFFRELAMMALLVLTITGFCCLLGTLCPGSGVLGALLPLTLVAAAAFCPVFVNVRSYPWLSGLLPPYYYLYGLGNPSLALGAAIYAAVTLAASYFLYPRLRCR